MPIHRDGMIVYGLREFKEHELERIEGKLIEQFGPLSGAPRLNHYTSPGRSAPDAETLISVFNWLDEECAGRFSFRHIPHGQSVGVRIESEDDRKRFAEIYGKYFRPTHEF